MRSIVLYLSFAFGLCVAPASAFELYVIEKEILVVYATIDSEMRALSRYSNLKSFCSDNNHQQKVIKLVDQMHRYHDQLEEELNTTTYNHSKRTIKRILNHMDKLDRKFNLNALTDFFEEQCTFQSEIERLSIQNQTRFGTHSYGSMVYAQEVVMYRHVKRLTRRITSIKKHVEHFYLRRKIWEH